MDYSKLVPSIELCEEMARLGICQDEPELCYMNCQDDINKSWLLVVGVVPVEHIIAPTLSRMMEELGNRLSTCHYGIDFNENNFPFVTIWGHKNFETGENLPNAVAKALIDLKKG